MRTEEVTSYWTFCVKVFLRPMFIRNSFVLLENQIRPLTRAIKMDRIHIEKKIIKNVLVFSFPLANGLSKNEKVKYLWLFNFVQLHYSLFVSRIYSNYVFSISTNWKFNSNSIGIQFRKTKALSIILGNKTFYDLLDV